MGKMTRSELQTFLEEEFPQITLFVEEIKPMGAKIRMPTNTAHLRPGGTISGPTLMTAADVAMYVALLSEIGPVALAVTTNLNINFFRKPSPGDIVAEAKLFKIGKHLAIGEAMIFSAESEESVAHATMTYSIPPQSKSQ